ncbi:MAG TPA: hypothetical protein IAA61_09095 [Candidatus Ornithomonoglobus merdipullorum]|uniref:S-layer protein n=1 Tax=Candidatus Ornithomonoglobus merdipullorum TaxID=2840895 RepID=A0A9D1MD28_9FIRM|nr:hypothetical protein [Candidatus Ornithomonoglobus merdipullorum]
MRKKLTALLMSLAMLIGMLVPISGVRAAQGITHEREVSLMAALGIVTGYPDSYNASEAVTGADFVTYAARATGTVVQNAAETAADYGLGDGSAQITVAQAIDVMFRLTDYTRMASFNSGDSYSYARSNGVLDGVSHFDKNSGMTLENAIVLIYNILELPAVVFDNTTYSYSDKTVMEEKLDVYEEKGIVTANHETSLSGYDNVGTDSVRIDDRAYNVGDTTAQDLLGYSVDFYYQDKDGEAVIKWIEQSAANDSTMVIYGCDIEGIDGRRITFYTSDDRSKTVTISNDADIIYNGVRNDELSPEVMQSLTCEIALIDNGRSGSYNVVIVNDFEYYFVDSYSADTGLVNDYSAEKSLSLNEDDYTSMRISMDGNPVTTSSIMQGQVLAAAKSGDGSVLRVEILTGSVTGEVTSYSEDELVIAGTAYYISPAYAGDQLKLGRTGTFYFDRLGKIVRSAVERGQSSKYGYLMKFYSETDGETNYIARILTAAGSVEEFKVKDTISFNGSKTSPHNAYGKMYDGTGCEQLITYAVNSNNEIASINTADERYIGVDEENIDAFTLNYKGTGRYRRNNMCFNSKYLVDGTTPVFLIPYNGEEDEYSVQNTSYLTNNWTYDISVYDIDSYMYASAIVVRENIIEPENLRTKRSFIVTKVLEAVDEDGEEGVMLEGYQQGSRVSYMLDNENMYDNRGNVMVKSLTAGDVLQLGINTKNKINAVQLLYRASTDSLSIASGTSTPNEYWEGGTAVFPDLWVSKGVVTDRSSDVILVDSDGDDTVVSKKPHKLGSVTTYLYQNGKMSVSSKNEISVGDNVYVHEYQGNVQEVIIVR